MPASQPKNHIALMDVDIVLDDVPDMATVQQEIFSELTQLAQVDGPQNVPFDVVLEMAPIPRRREVLKKLEMARAASAQAAIPAQQLAVAEKTADIQKTKSEMVKNLAAAKAQEVETVRSAMEGHMAAVTPMPPPGMTGDQGPVAP